MNHWARAQKRYIGSAVDLSKRLKDYYSASELKRNNNYINRAIICHTHSAFSLSILEYIDISTLSKEEARKLILSREQHYIDCLSPEYNILPTAGCSLGYKHTAESLAKMSGGNNHFYSKTHKLESLAKMSEAKKGIPKSDTHKAKISAANGTTIYIYCSNDFTLINTFPSSYKAAEHFNCSKNTIFRYIKSGKLFKGEYILSINLK
jgi:group I intron endonuclease